jgi:hypothetical protein
MLGTFKPGDKLTIGRIPFSQIKKGDLVVFRGAAPDPDQFVVHRVTGVTASGLATRGDNCHQADQDPVHADVIIGRVKAFDRNGAKRRAWNGGLGMLRARAIRLRRSFLGVLKAALRTPYRALRKSGIAARLWRPELVKIDFATPAGPMIKLVRNGQTVATFWIGQKTCCCKRPYDLLLVFRMAEVFLPSGLQNGKEPPGPDGIHPDAPA